MGLQHSILRGLTSERATMHRQSGVITLRVNKTHLLSESPVMHHACPITRIHTRTHRLRSERYNRNPPDQTRPTCPVLNQDQKNKVHRELNQERKLTVSTYIRYSNKIFAARRLFIIPGEGGGRVVE